MLFNNGKYNQTEKVNLSYKFAYKLQCVKKQGQPLDPVIMSDRGGSTLKLPLALQSQESLDRMGNESGSAVGGG